MNPRELSDDQLYRPFWRAGYLRFLCSPEQEPIYDEIRKWVHARYVLHASRRFGKDYLFCMLMDEVCNTIPNALCLALHANLEVGVPILRATMEQHVLRTCPQDMRPRWAGSRGQENLSGNAYVYERTGSEIRIRNLNDYDENRGLTINLIAYFEAGFSSKLSAASQAIAPGMLGRWPGVELYQSNAADDEDHEFFRLLDEAVPKGAGWIRDIHTVTRYSAEDKARECERQGGPHSEGWLREYLCQRIGRGEGKVVPEFAPRAHEVWVSEVVQDSSGQEKEVVRAPQEGERGNPPLVREVEPPDYYDTYVSIDTGHKDLMVALFSYWDFLEQRLVVVDELVFAQGTLDRVALQVVEKERELWPLLARPFHRTVDATLLDWKTLSSMGWSATRTDNRQPVKQLGTLRVLVRAGDLAVHPRCLELIQQLSTGRWNTAGTSFERTEDHGHLDAISSLVYLHSSISKKRNPYPVLPRGVHTQRDLIPKALREAEEARQGGGFRQLAKSMKKRR